MDTLFRRFGRINEPRYYQIAVPGGLFAGLDITRYVASRTKCRPMKPVPPRINRSIGLGSCFATAGYPGSDAPVLQQRV